MPLNNESKPWIMDNGSSGHLIVFHFYFVLFIFILRPRLFDTKNHIGSIEDDIASKTCREN